MHIRKCLENGCYNYEEGLVCGHGMPCPYLNAVFTFHLSLFSFQFSVFRSYQAPLLGITGPYAPSVGIKVVDSVAYTLAGPERDAHIG